MDGPGLVGCGIINTSRHWAYEYRTKKGYAVQCPRERNWHLLRAEVQSVWVVFVE